MTLLNLCKFGRNPPTLLTTLEQIYLQYESLNIHSEQRVQHHNIRYRNDFQHFWFYWTTVLFTWRRLLETSSVYQQVNAIPHLNCFLSTRTTTSLTWYLWQAKNNCPHSFVLTGLTHRVQDWYWTQIQINLSLMLIRMLYHS